MSVKGEALVRVERNNVSAMLPLFVVDHPDVEPIYGLDWLATLEPELYAAISCARINNTDHREPRLLEMCAVDRIKACLTTEPGAKPVFFKPRQIPYGILEDVKNELRRMESEGQLERVESSDWATPIVCVRKQSGKIRICGDYKVTLNPVLKRMVSTTPSIDEVMSKLGGARIFSTLDLTNAYLQVPVDTETSAMQTWSTPFGLYRPTALAYGVKQAPAIFQSYMDKLLLNLEGVVSYQDDILVWGQDQTSHDERLSIVLKTIREHGLAINKEKCVFNKPSIRFLGFEVSGKGIRPIQEKTDGIVGMQEPQDLKQLQSFIGMVDFYGRCVPNLATIKEPLTHLTRSGVRWTWGTRERDAFNAIKERLHSAELLKPFDPADEVTLTTDASPVGLGAVLEQSSGPVLFISKTLTRAERNYAQIEREALAIIWAVKRLHKYLLGRKFVIRTDHHPLKFLYDPGRAVSTVAAARLQRWAITLMEYDYVIECRRSEEIPVADALSRLNNRTAEQEQFDVNSVQDCLLDIPIDKERLRHQSRSDKELRLLFASVKNGWTPHGLQRLSAYARFRDELVIENKLLYRGVRLLIPRGERQAVLQLLHEGHMGADKMKSIARQCVWWPGLDSDVTRYAKGCIACQENKDHGSPRQWTSWPDETEKWSRVHVDYAGPMKGDNYLLVIIDAFSKWAEVHVTKSTTSAETIRRLRRTFSQEGIPATLVSDNGPQFTSKEMEGWLRGIGCRHVLTPPYHPRSNGLAERFVRDLKNHLRASGKAEDDLQTSVDRFLLQYRNSQHSTTGKAPSELMRGHFLRTATLSLAREPVWVKTYRNETEKWRAGEVVSREGKAIVGVQLDDGKYGRFHREQTKPRSPEAPACPEEDATEVQADQTERGSSPGPLQRAEGVRRGQRLRKAPDRLHYSKSGVPDDSRQP